MSVDQANFDAALLNPDHPIPDGLVDAGQRPAGRRFNVYRNNVAASLGEALATAFPVITKLLGAANMKGLAQLYYRTHPPRSPLMMFFGADFPGFLEQTEALSHLGYLPDVARLELALRHAYHAADANPIDPDTLGQIAPEALMGSRLRLAPAVQIVRSPWPIHDIWRLNTEEGAGRPRAVAQDVLVTRPEFDPLPLLLPPGAADWIEALQSGATIGKALAAQPDRFDLSEPLALLLQGQAITVIDPKD